MMAETAVIHVVSMSSDCQLHVYVKRTRNDAESDAQANHELSPTDPNPNSSDFRRSESRCVRMRYVMSSACNYPLLSTQEPERNLCSLCQTRAGSWTSKIPLHDLAWKHNQNNQSIKIFACEFHGLRVLI